MDTHELARRSAAQAGAGGGPPAHGSAVLASLLAGFMAVRAGQHWAGRAPPMAGPEQAFVDRARAQDALAGNRRGAMCGTPAEGPTCSGADILRDACPRALRQLPGLGPLRAEELARTRWRQASRPDGLALADVPGIGAETERELAEALEIELPAGGLWIRR